MSNGSEKDPGLIASNLGPEESSFVQIVADRIAALPLPTQAVNPYEKRTRPIGIPVNSGFDLRYHEDGRIDFGSRFETRQQWVNGIELTFALDNKSTDTEILVHQFHEDGGLAVRTEFKDMEDGNIWKCISLSPWKWMGLDGGPVLGRPMDEEEAKALKIIMSNPEEHADALTSLVTVTPEEKAVLDEGRRLNEEKLIELHEDLAEIARLQRKAEVDSRNIIIY